MLGDRCRGEALGPVRGPQRLVPRAKAHALRAGRCADAARVNPCHWYSPATEDAAAAELKAAKARTCRAGDERPTLRAKPAVTGLIGLVLAGCGGGAAKHSPYTAEGLKVKVEHQLVGTRKKIDASHGHSTRDGLVPRASCTVRTATTLRCNVMDVNLEPFGGETVDVTVDPQTGQTRSTAR